MTARPETTKGFAAEKSATLLAMSSETSTPTAVDPVARQLNAAFLAGLVLLVPVRGALGTTTYDALFYWTLAGLAIMVAFGFVLRVTQVPQALGIVLTTSGIYTVSVVIALAIVGNLGDPGSDTTVTLMAGIPAAAVAAPATTAVVHWTSDNTGATAVGAVCAVLGLTIAISAGPSIGELLDDAREQAADARAFEEAGLSPYLPEIDGMVPEYDGKFTSTAEGSHAVVGYSMTYEQESSGEQSWDAASISLNVLRPEGAACEEISDYLACIENDGYVITERDGVADAVSADVGGMRLTATVREGTGDVPDMDAIGRALVGADEVEWDEVVSLDQE